MAKPVCQCACKWVYIQILPLMSLRQAFPEWVGADHAFNELLPQHTLRDDPLPFLTHKLCRA